MKSNFLLEFSRGLLHDSQSFQTQHTDFLRFETPALGRAKSKLKDAFSLLAYKAGFTRRQWGVDAASMKLSFILQNIEGFDRFYQLLADQPSRQMMVALLRLKVLGSRRVKLPINNASFWKKHQSVQKYIVERHTIKTPWNWYLNRYNIKGKSGSINLHVHPLNILNTFLLEQYVYQHGDRKIGAEMGDVVIDAGGCWGDTAIYFADRVGKEGKVYSFEFVTQNLEIFQTNLALNPELGKTIEIVKNACGEKTGDVMNYSPDGPGTNLEKDAGKTITTVEVLTLSIDDLVKEKGLNKIDYIKMDIEGFELKALQGAEKTLREFKPKLAIALYHKDEDFILIPNYLNQLNLGYQFFLDHFTVYDEETILFAV